LDKEGEPIGAQAQSHWLKVVPWGLYKLLKYTKAQYGTDGSDGRDLEIMITENGVSVPGEADVEVEEAVQDAFRVDYYARYIDQLCMAVAEGAHAGG